MYDRYSGRELANIEKEEIYAIELGYSYRSSKFSANVNTYYTKWKNKPSKFFMDFSKNLLEKEKFKINNIDVTLICEKPNFSKYKHKMRKSISDTLNLEIDKVNVKATTTEKLGFVGRQEGIACQSVVSISKIDEIE